jgi:hypothetical protein
MTGVTRCPCCDADVMDTGPVCEDCREVVCRATVTEGGDQGYTSCARDDG